MRKPMVVCTAGLALLCAFGMCKELRAEPDLYVSEFSLAPSTPVQGSPVSVRIGVYNRGTSRSGAFTVEWWPGENYTRPALTWRVDGVNARGGRILTGTYGGYPSWYARLTTKAVVDSRGEVRESNESDNQRRISIRVLRPGSGGGPEGGSGGTFSGQPDLYVSEFSLDPPTPAQGRPVRVRIGVYNRGAAPADSFSVQWWAGRNFPYPAHTWRVDGLPARGGRILQFTYDGYQSWYGALTTKVVADSRGEVREDNESNNERTMDIRVGRTESSGQPDLFISEFSLDPPTPTQGQPVRVRIGVYNRGTAPAGAFKVEWWGGSNFTGPTHTWQVPGLPARGGRILHYTYDGYRSWYSNLTTKAVADPLDEVSELNESNNASNIRISVDRR